MVVFKNGWLIACQQIRKKARIRYVQRSYEHQQGKYISQLEYSGIYIVLNYWFHINDKFIKTLAAKWL